MFYNAFVLVRTEWQKQICKKWISNFFTRNNSYLCIISELSLQVLYDEFTKNLTFNYLYQMNTKYNELCAMVDV